MDTGKMARIFNILSAETRIKIISLLKEKTLCVGALARHLNITQAAVSQHLRLLKDADLLIPDKRGYYVHYLVNEKTLKEWRGALSPLLDKEEVPCKEASRKCVGPKNKRCHSKSKGSKD